MNKIFTFKPYLKTVVWGGDKIKNFKNIDTDQTNIGESSGKYRECRGTNLLSTTARTAA